VKKNKNCQWRIARRPSGNVVNDDFEYREVDIPKEACEKMARDAMKQTRLLVNNPREVTEKDALNIYQSAW